MGKNKRILYISISVIVIVTIVLGGVVDYFKINKPVFIESFYDYSIYLWREEEYNEYEGEILSPYYLNEELYLNYITNREDNRYITGVYFIDAPEIVVDAQEYINSNTTSVMNFSNTYRYDETYGRYRVHSARLNLTAGYEEIPDELDLSKAMIVFNDGENREVNLGKVILNCNDSVSRDKELVALSENIYEDYTEGKYKVKKNIIVEKVEGNPIKELQGSTSIKIDDYESDKINGLAFSAGKELTVKSFYNEDKSCISKYYNAKFMPKIYYRDSEGNKFSEDIAYINQQGEEFSFIGIYKYLKERGEL